MVNVAPWHASKEAFDIAAAPVSVACVVPLTPPLLAGTSMDRPVWLLNDTPVVVQPEWLASAVMSALVPFSDTPVTLTANGFGLLTLISTSPVTPGYREALVLADTSTVLSAVAG